MGQLGQLLTPSIYDAVQSGTKDGQDVVRQKTLAQYAQPALGGDQGALAKIYGVDPNAGLQVQQNAGKLSDDAHKRLADFTKTVSALAQGGDLDSAKAYYRSNIGQVQSATGMNLGTELDPGMLPHIQQIASALNPTDKKDLIDTAPGHNYIDPSTGKVVYSAPAAPTNLTPIQTDSGYAAFDPKTGTAQPVNYAGSSAGQPQPVQGGFQTTITPASPANTGAATQANALLAKGMDPTSVMQQIVQANPGQKFQLAVDPATGQFKDVSDGGAQIPQVQGAPSMGGPSGRVMPAAKESKQVRTLTDAELKQYNLPAGTVAQVDGNGRLNVVNKGDISSGLTDDAAGMLSTAAQQGYKIPIPSLGMKSGGDRTKFLNKLAADVKTSGVDMPTAIRNMVYGQAGIFATNAMQKNYGVTMQNEMSAQRQADIALDASSKLARGDVQALNQWWVSGKKQFGSVDAQNYANAINTFAEEYAKVMSGSNGSAASSDSARATAHKMINEGLSNGQMEGVVGLMKREMRGRTQGQLDAIQSQVKGLRNFGGNEDGTDPAGQAVPGSQASPQQSQGSPPDHDPLGLLK